ncbi:MAG TPA: xanthine dehydrogenase family protein subunit M [Thermoleophilaceae bacterium]|nr:xanthine dehydrogenase family protein subunit M [Thermoleophilaceae bacterium]
MKPAPFAYHAPDQLDEVLALLADGDREARVLAGGQSLVPMMNFRLAAPDVLVDLRRVDELRHMRREGDILSIAAGVRQSALLREPFVREHWPLLAEGVRHIGHPQVRSRGTVCGSLAHHDPTAELPALAVALDARMVIASASGRREMAAEDFFVSHYEVALAPGEMLLEVRFPPCAAWSGWSFKELARRRGDFALVGVAALVQASGDGTVSAARIVLCGVGERPFRARAAEDRLTGEGVSAEALEDAGRLVSEDGEPSDTIHASAEYKREAAGVMTVRALAQAWERANGG